MHQIALTADLAALAQVIVIDVTLAGDNAIVVGMAVAGLRAQQKRPAILLGILGATAIRIALGAIALKLLAVIGLLVGVAASVVMRTPRPLDIRRSARR